MLQTMINPGNRCRIGGGAHAGKLCLVLEIPSLYPTFAKVVMLDAKGEKTRLQDLVPLSYLTIAGHGHPASTPSSNG